MGCDIHAYIEVEVSPIFSETYVESVGEIKINRDYILFSLMAGVGGFILPVVPPRGLPSNPGYKVFHNFHILINDILKEEHENVCSSIKAKQWIAEGLSKYSKVSNNFITNPDWHTPSWLYIKELEEVQERYVALSTTGLNQSLQANIEAMKALKTFTKNPRLVFWFDN